MAVSQGTEPIPFKVKLAYSSPSLPLAMLGVTFYAYLSKFYIDVVGVNLTVLGWIVLLSRVWDALIDPLVGSMSDRTTHAWGRRRPWIAYSVLPLAIAFYLLLNPLSFLSTTGATIWLAVFTFVFFLFWTTVNVPYEAWGAELTFDYDERVRLFSFREGALVLGTLFSAILPELILLILRGSGADGVPSPEVERARFFWLSTIYSVLLLVCVMWCVLKVQERIRTVTTQAQIGLKTLWVSLSNKPFRILLLAYLVSGFGLALPATLIFFFTEHVLQTTNGATFLLIYFLVGFVFFPIWPRIAAHWGKKEAWIAAMLVNSGAFVGVLFLGPGQTTSYGILVALSALGYGGVLALPSAMQADVIDYDEWLHGGRREGQFIGLWSVVKKLAAALGAGVAFPIMDAAGYIAATGPTLAHVAQPSSAIFAIQVLYAGVPCVCNALAIGIVYFYPINRELHSKIRNEIDARGDATLH